MGWLAFQFLSKSVLNFRLEALRIASDIFCSFFGIFVDLVSNTVVQSPVNILGIEFYFIVIFLFLFFVLEIF